MCCKDQYMICLEGLWQNIRLTFELHHYLNVLVRENTHLRHAHLKIQSFCSFFSYSRDGIGAPFMGSLAECESVPCFLHILPMNLYNTLANAVAGLYCDTGSHNLVFNINTKSYSSRKKMFCVFTITVFGVAHL